MKGSSFKRKLINFRRVFLSGFSSFFRNAWLSTAATIVMTITLSSILLTLLAIYTSNNTIKSFTDRIDASIYFSADAKKSQIDGLINDLKQNPNLGVREVTYISSEQAKETYVAENAGNVLELQAIAQLDVKEAFPASLKVKTNETKKLNEVLDFAKQPQYTSIVDQKSFNNTDKRTAVDRLGDIARFLRNVGLVASVIFGVISILVILNTIRMAIFNRKNEIEIMRLIGASRWYIRGPFLVESMVYGLIAGILSSALFYLVVLTQAPKIGDYVEEIRPTIDKFQELSWVVIPGTIVLGMLIGLFSSVLAIRKHLKLKTSKLVR